MILNLKIRFIANSVFFKNHTSTSFNINFIKPTSTFFDRNYFNVHNLHGAKILPSLGVFASRNCPIGGKIQLQQNYLQYLFEAVSRKMHLYPIFRLTVNFMVV